MPHHRRFQHARDALHHPLDIVREDVQAFGGDDHLLLASADEEPALRIELADIAGVEPALGIARASRFGLIGVARLLSPRLSPAFAVSLVSLLPLGFEIPLRHVLAADQNLAILRDPRRSTPPTGVPTDPVLVLNGWLSVTIGAVSVSP